jgi:hypothetical protein
MKCYTSITKSSHTRVLVSHIHPVLKTDFCHSDVHNKFLCIFEFPKSQHVILPSNFLWFHKQWHIILSHKAHLSSLGPFRQTARGAASSSCLAFYHCVLELCYVTACLYINVLNCFPSARRNSWNLTKTLLTASQILVNENEDIISECPNFSYLLQCDG